VLKKEHRIKSDLARDAKGRTAGLGFPLGCRRARLLVRNAVRRGFGGTALLFAIPYPMTRALSPAPLTLL